MIKGVMFSLKINKEMFSPVGITNSYREAETTQLGREKEVY